MDRGIEPQILLQHVANTAPFLFDEAFVPSQKEPHLEFLRSPQLGSSVDYFRLCLSAHHATVATFVPTDVDSAIRSRLWDSRNAVETIASMAKIVLQSFYWSNDNVSARNVGHEIGGPPLSGHQGEWLSTMVAAYAALRSKDPVFCESLLEALCEEIEREKKILMRLWEEKRGCDLLRACTVVAHNLGDLDRVMDMWVLPESDPLRKKLYRLGHDGKGILFVAGIVNKNLMAKENHRHLPLRKAKCLRRSPDFLIPIGPFFDDWGTRIATHPGLTDEEVGSVVEALIDGATSLESAVGYARALRGILEAFPGGEARLQKVVPARARRVLQKGQLRALISVPKPRLESQWEGTGLKEFGKYLN